MSFSSDVVESQSFGPITQEMLKSYAEASGDFNPIHLDEEVAKKAGLPGVIAHGMLIAAYIAERAEEFIAKENPGENYRWSEFQTRFKAMTFLGDSPSVGGTVKRRTPEELVLDLQARNQKGEITTTGVAKFVLR